MMKIKFNMDFRGEYIRNLEDLRNNFSVEDILEAYDNGLLVRWLDARGGYREELEQVQAIKTKTATARGVLEELIRIFCPETKQEEIDENLSLYDYLEEHRKYREYITANGLADLQALRIERDTLNDENAKLRTELEALRKERDSLRQERDKNARLRNELEALRKENDNLKHQIEPQKQSSTSKSSSSSLIEARIPAGYTINWQVIRGKGKRYRIKGIGNSAYSLTVKAADGRCAFSIEEAIAKEMIFDGLSVYVRGGRLRSGLYFYYEEV